MKIEYDKESDTLTLTLRKARVKESDEVRPGVIVDFDGAMISTEFTGSPNAFQYAAESIF